MTESSLLRLSKFLPYFRGELGTAVFNCTSDAKRKARHKIILEYGVDVYNREIKAKTKRGIQELFAHPATRIARRYMWYVAMATDLYYQKQVRKRLTVDLVDV